MNFRLIVILFAKFRSFCSFAFAFPDIWTIIFLSLGTICGANAIFLRFLIEIHLQLFFILLFATILILLPFDWNRIFRYLFFLIENFPKHFSHEWFASFSLLILFLVRFRLFILLITNYVHVALTIVHHALSIFHFEHSFRLCSFRFEFFCSIIDLVVE